MSTTKKIKVNQNFDRLLKCRANGYYDYVDVVIPTNDTKNINVEMQEYGGLKYIVNTQGGEGVTIIDFSDTVLPWKFEMNNYLARTRYCLKPYSETPYQVEILKQVPTNYNIVGTPTINDNIVSGFSSSNYLTIKRELISNNNATYVLKFTTGDDITTNQVIMQKKYFIDIEISASEGVLFYTWSPTGRTSLFTPQPNTTYWLKVVINGMNRTYSYSTNGVDFSNEVTVEDSSLSTTDSSNLCLGLHSIQLANPFQGSIDLSECYVDLDGIKFNLSDATYIKQWNLNKHGSVVVSEDGVISNFSSSNYVSISNVHINTEEDLIIKFTTGDDISTLQNIFAGDCGLYLRSGNLYNWSESAYSDVLVFNGIQANTTYWVKYRFYENGKISVGVSNNESDYEWVQYTDTTQILSNEAMLVLGIFTGDTRRYFRGSIDFANSSIPRSSGKTITEELYGIIDGTDFSILESIYCYANRDERVLLRNTKTEKMDTTDWYLGEVELGD